MKKTKIIRLQAILATFSLCVGPVTGAGTWDEITDGGGETGVFVATAQATVGTGTLSTISGQQGGAKADLFAITIPNPALFSASYSGGFSKQLFLFDLSCTGITAVGGAGNSITGALLPAPGIYILGVVRSGAHPESPAGDIWNVPLPTAETAPTGIGAPGPHTAWGGATHNAFEFYAVDLVGAEYAPEFEKVPEPSSLAMALVGLGILLGIRRRR